MKNIYLFAVLIMCGVVLIGCGKKGGAANGVTDPNGSMTTMYKLLEAGDPVTCTFQKTTTDGATFSGIVSIKDASTMRHQAVSTYASQSIEMNLLLLDDRLYSWLPGDHKKGYTFPTISGGVETSRRSVQKEIDESLLFACKKGAQEDLFTIPTDITFEDY